ncbi:MAG: PIN domain-containing protein [Myxococcales bacterium]|nr:PIN domain-containing protein [Myxococcales bacterium]
MVDAFVTDTHPLIWYAAGATRKLGRKARGAFEAYEAGGADLFVPAPVVLETWFLARKGVIEVDGRLERWWASIANARLFFLAVTAAQVFRAQELVWDHPDAMDRLIVAAALDQGLPLVTADVAIARWGGAEVLW